MAHAKRSPSAADRWVSCTGSQALVESGKVEVVNRPNKYSALGTLKHELSESVLCDATTVHEIITGDRKYHIDGFDLELTDDDIEHIVYYVTYVREQMIQAPDASTYFEVKIDITTVMPDFWGTADTLMLRNFDRIKVIDAKFGAGVKIYADTLQCGAYALGAWDTYREETMADGVEVIIVQPPLNHVDTKFYSKQELEELREKFRAADAAIAKGGEFVVADKTCKFCPVKLACPALGNAAQEKARQVFGSSDPVPTSAQLADLADLIGPLESWIKAVEEEIKVRIENGVQVPRWKQVEGKRSREFDDETKLVNDLVAGKVATTDEIFSTVLLSPAKLEKVLKDRFDLTPYIVWKTGAPTIVPESDKRPAISKAALVFK